MDKKDDGFFETFKGILAFILIFGTFVVVSALLFRGCSVMTGALFD